MAETEKPEAYRSRELEDELKEANRRLAEMRAERDEAHALVERMEENVSDADAMIEQWKAAFNMELGDDGLWSFQDGIGEQFEELLARYRSITKKWNTFVPEYNAIVAPKRSKQAGRPLDASEAQCLQVLKLRRAGTSIRNIVEETNLGLQTVRTILGRQTRTDRTSIKRLEKYDPENAAAVSAKARKRIRDALPKRIKMVQDDAVSLLKEAKGLGKK